MPRPDPDRPSTGTRRAFLRAAGLGGLGLFWADWVRAELSGAARGNLRIAFSISAIDLTPSSLK